MGYDDVAGSWAGPDAVLRRVARERDAILAEDADALTVNTPDWLARRWSAAYGPEQAGLIFPAR